MDKIKSFTGEIELRNNSEVIFNNIVFDDVKINSCGSSIKFVDCFLRNDLKIYNASEVSFENCTFLFNSETKDVSVNVISSFASLENVYIDDTEKGNSVVSFNCENFNGSNICFLSKRDNCGKFKSFLDILYVKECLFDDSSIIDANVNYYKLSSRRLRILK